ncbi:hypothetical protein J6590_052895 [Homalodisca vitripennis]|nr:hypothetical protein J6590_052895 [Homalodisca vitripennis]
MEHVITSSVKDPHIEKWYTFVGDGKIVLVVLFVKQLHRDPLAVSACGFFPIDRQLIISMIVSMTTYYMVIIQLGPELGRLTASLFGLE